MALRALDGSANACQLKTTLKVVPGADDVFAIGMWIKTSAYEPTGSVYPRPFAWRNSADVNQCQTQIITGSTASPSFYFDRRSGAAITGGEIQSGAADGKWRYTIARSISTTSFRVTTIDPNGTLYIGSGVTDVAALDTTTVNELVFGHNVASAAITDIAEFWICASDPFKGFTDVPRDLMFQLAYNGPFSNSRVAGALQFYASFEEGIRCDKPGHYRGAAPLEFVSGVQTGNRSVPHPQLAPGYWRPGDPAMPGMF